MNGLHTSKLKSLPLLARGKVRDNYAVGEQHILMLASDRISAYDVIMPQAIPNKGILLTQMALFWFDKLKHICPNHLVKQDLTSVVAKEELDLVAKRSLLVKRLTPLPIEAVVRGYLAGSGWQEYQQSQTVCDVPLPSGLQNASKLPQPIFTPATKAEFGEHDENISFATMVTNIGAELAEQVRSISIELYQQAASFALTKGIIIADTKFEFGLDENNQLILMDEVLTPDSSRYWPIDGYQQALNQGKNPPSYDKQFLRDWLTNYRDDNGQPWNKTTPAPNLPAQIISQTASKYQQAFDQLTS